MCHLPGVLESLLRLPRSGQLRGRPSGGRRQEVPLRQRLAQQKSKDHDGHAAKPGKRHCSGIRLMRFYESLWGELKLPKRSRHSDSIYYASIVHSVWYIVFDCCVSCAFFCLALEPWNHMESPCIT